MEKLKTPVFYHIILYTMILINYWTSQFFEINIWDKFYCKNFKSAKNFLKEYMEALCENKENIDWTLKDLKVLEFNNKTDGQSTINISCPYRDLYINIEQIDLI